MPHTRFELASEYVRRRVSVKKSCLGVALLVALTSLPAFGQKKEQERVANAGKVMQEIINIPDDSAS
jgi:hypothetical protein